jgi:hypothetical protein
MGHFATNLPRSSKIRKKKIGAACGTYGGQERFRFRNLKKRNHLEDLGIDGNILFQYSIFNTDLQEI